MSRTTAADRARTNEISDWKELTLGQPVLVDPGDGRITRAVVDALFEDGSIIWLRSEPIGWSSLHLSEDLLTLYRV
ncbi:hypothetical protein [Paenarthrobacter sp. 2TAF44]|uniref:hypothetical protein n=1 Tax=Paenarthrobacter sp. 2TAF44 TaxID=3233018 RepID=UPI003F952576